MVDLIRVLVLVILVVVVVVVIRSRWLNTSFVPRRIGFSVREAEDRH